MIEVNLADGTVLRFPEGTSDDVINNTVRGLMSENARPAVLPDVAQSAGSGLARGVAGLLDIPSDIGGLVDRGLTAAMNKGLQAMGGEGNLVAPPAVPKARDALAAVAPSVAEYEPQTTAGEYAQTVGEFIPGGLLGGGGVGAAVKYGVIPGLASEAAGQATEDTAAEPYARLAAAVAAPSVASGAQNLMSRVLSPFGGVNAARAELVKTLDDAGVPLTAGQRLGSETLQGIEARTRRGGEIKAAQPEAFTRAVLKTVGVTADAATPEVLDDAARIIGHKFDDALGGVDIATTPDLMRKMGDALEEYKSLAPAAQAPPLFENINRELFRAHAGGTVIPATTAKSWRSRLSKLTRRSDPETRSAAVMAIDALDDAFNAAVTKAGRPEAAANFAEARGQFRNLLAIETAASRVGAADGILSPQQLRNIVVQQVGPRAYSHGRGGELVKLARASDQIRPLPTVREGGMRGVSGIDAIGGGGAGALVGGSLGIPGGAALGAMAGAAAPMVGREIMMAPAVQRYLVRSGGVPTVPLMSPQAARTVPGGLLSADLERYLSEVER